MQPAPSHQDDILRHGQELGPAVHELRSEELIGQQHQCCVTNKMTRDQPPKETHIYDAGPLGWIEGVTLTEPSSGRPLSHYFGGLPYALPPTGPYRFRQARPLPDRFRYGTKKSPGRYTRGAATCPQPGFRQAPDESEWDEDCLQLNIHIPAGTPPPSGWPVFFYIHGGFLQWGSCNTTPEALTSLLSETAFRAIIVAPAYRLNALGFLASRELQAEANLLGEPVGNQGFWDQRLALEWTAENISHFHGDPDNVTVGGYSAGSHSTFQQLAHELYFVPDNKAIIKRVIMWSNSPGVQPKSIAEQQTQFDELLARLNISSSASASEKLEGLRKVRPHDLIEATERMNIHEFRATSDGAFISKNSIAHINNGDFAKRMKARGIRLMNGECRDEHNLYRAWRTPQPSYEAVYARLCADYPEQAVKKLMQLHCGSERHLPRGSNDWQDAFGKLYAAMQVHDLERGFHKALMDGGLIPGKDLLRYRFNWRTKKSFDSIPADWGVTHSTDMSIWFWGEDYANGLTHEEKRILKPWNDAFSAFVKGEDVKWGTVSVKEMLRLREDGKTDVWRDDRWEDGLKVWHAVNGSAGTGVLNWLKSKL